LGVLPVGLLVDVSTPDFTDSVPVPLPCFAVICFGLVLVFRVFPIQFLLVPCTGVFFPDSVIESIWLGSCLLGVLPPIKIARKGWLC
jgi:hypothetical protein